MKPDRKKRWRQRVREYLAAAFGNKCAICGYDACRAAFDYHHVEDKDQALSVAMRNGYAWAKIVREARKCVLLCCRCHRELHAGVAALPANYPRFNEDYADVMTLRQREFDACPVCGVEKPKKQQYCSRMCHNGEQKRFDPSREELEQLVASNTYTAVGRLFGVSDNAIKKRCRQLGIKLLPRRQSAGVV